MDLSDDDLSTFTKGMSILSEEIEESQIIDKSSLIEVPSKNNSTITTEDTKQSQYLFFQGEL